MLHWRAENSSLLLETEVDALSQDEDGYTPLVYSYLFTYCFFFNCLHHSLASLPPRKEAYCTLNKRLVLDVYGKSRPHGVRNKFLYRLSWPQ